MTEEPPDFAVAPARIRYQGDQPYSLDYQDIYHAGDGAAEVRRVFVAPCRLDELAQERSTRAQGVVRVGELGFGSGLNFVVAAERCLAAGARLHFVSCEAHPLDADDFAAIARHRTRSHPLYQELAAVYPPRVRGWHQRILAGGRVSLNLWFGTAHEALDDLAGRQQQPLDAWFLDGFAPDRNPELWEAGLFEKLGALSGRGTRIATFTAAGRVRRALEAAGFAMVRVDQRPHKRESLAGSFARTGLVGFEPPRGVTVAGGGLAGAAVAWQLARSGCRVTLVDPDDSPGIPATVLHTRLLGDASPAALLRTHAFLYAAALVPGMDGFRATGALQIAGESRGEDVLEALAHNLARAGSWVHWLDRSRASDLARWPVDAGGLYLAGAGVVDIPALVAALRESAGVEHVRSRLEVLPDTQPAVVACGAGSRDFPQSRYLELAGVAGQVDFVGVHRAPSLPLVGSGYLVPTGDGLLAAGSTYEYQPWSGDDASRANLAQLKGRDYEWRFSRRATRAVSSDRAAVAGPLFHPDGQLVPDLYVTTGHGSAGNTSAHLAAAVVAGHLTGDCPPLARAVEAVLSPWRFHQRQARRGALPAWDRQ